jgi:hypothetical protein
VVKNTEKRRSIPCIFRASPANRSFLPERLSPYFKSNGSRRVTRSRKNITWNRVLNAYASKVEAEGQKLRNETEKIIRYEDKEIRTKR